MNSWTLPEAEPFKLSLKMCKAIYVTQKGGSSYCHLLQNTLESQKEALPPNTNSSNN